jgi:hypothetical protein
MHNAYGASKVSGVLYFAAMLRYIKNLHTGDIFEIRM